MPYGNISRALNNEGNMSGTLTIQPTAGGGVSDVLVNGESVVTDHKAYVNIEVEQTVTEGKKIAGVIVNGNNTDILIPEIKIYDEATGDLITIDDAMEAPLEECKVTLEPQQDLHGYDSPWVGGAGKNKLKVTATSQTIGGVTFTINNDGTINVNGTATQNISLQLSRKNVNDAPLPEGQLIMTGCPSGGSTSSYYLTCWRTNSGSANDVGNGVTFAYQSDWDFVVSLVIKSGTTCNNLTFKPMIRLASVTDATFAPYSNICPISGWDEVDVNVSGVNIWDEEWEVGTYLNVNGNKYPSTTKIRNKNPISVKPNTTYYYYVRSTSADEDSIWCYDADMNFIRRFYYIHQTTIMATFTTPANCAYINFSIKNTTYNNDISINYPSTDTDYHAYAGTTYTIDLDGTRYGGELDVKSGVLKVTDGYIASYNGETLPSTWISDRDVYAPNTSPTTGAEVVYKLTTPQEIQLTPTEVTLLRGINNLWSDGEMYVKWRLDVEMLLQSIIDNR